MAMIDADIFLLVAYSGFLSTLSTLFLPNFESSINTTYGTEESLNNEDVLLVNGLAC